MVWVTRNSYFKMVMHLSRGEIIDQREILRQLADLQYTRNDIDFRRGTYRVRGDVIDIYPADSEREAVRIELFDEEIESLCWFDPLTGAVENRVARVTIYPKTHYVTPRETMLSAVEHIEEELSGVSPSSRISTSWWRRSVWSSEPATTLK